MWPDIHKITPFQQNHSHHLYEIGDGVEAGELLRPDGHALDGCEQAAQQNEDDEEKPGDEHSLLLGFSNGRNKDNSTRTI